MAIDSSKRIDELSRTEALYMKGNKYTSGKFKFLLEGGHLYFPIQKSPGVIKIKLLAEDPIEAQNYPSMCPCEDCEDNCKEAADMDFPIDGDLLEVMISMSVQELLAVSGQPTDNREQTKTKN
jgi:hypothetical protein